MKIRLMILVAVVAGALLLKSQEQRVTDENIDEWGVISSTADFPNEYSPTVIHLADSVSDCYVGWGTDIDTGNRHYVCNHVTPNIEIRYGDESVTFSNAEIFQYLKQMEAETPDAE